VRHDLGTSGDGGQGEPAAAGFSQSTELWNYAIVFLRPVVGEAKAGNHFVKAFSAPVPSERLPDNRSILLTDNLVSEIW
jgi:hypothetical protein